MTKSVLNRRTANSALTGLDTEAVVGDLENRSFERKACIKDATIRLEDGTEVSCVTRNASENGALIMLSDAVTLPKTVMLEFPNLDLKMEAEVRWQVDKRAGLHLVQWHVALPV